jgi:hypothetical protein
VRGGGAFGCADAAAHDVEMMALLLEFGADVNESGGAPIKAALWSAHPVHPHAAAVAAVRLLFDGGADVFFSAMQHAVMLMSIYGNDVYVRMFRTRRTCSLARGGGVGTLARFVRAEPSGQLEFVVRRECLFDDVMRAVISAIDNESLMSATLRVRFCGEDGIDCGGLRADMWTCFFKSFARSDLVERASSGQLWLKS